MTATPALPLTAEEVDAVRADFPYLARPARNGGQLAYLDWGATSQKPAAVIEAEAEFLRLHNGAAGRSTYQIADEATAVWEDARDAVAGLVGARAENLVFTKNATEALNLVTYTLGDPRSADVLGGSALGPGDTVVSTSRPMASSLILSVTSLATL